MSVLKRIARLWGGGLLLPGLLTGCSTTGTSWWKIDNCATVPPGAQPAPVGTYVRRFNDVQAAKAEADDFVIYKFEWYQGGDELGPYGRYHINEIIKRLPFVPFPVMIQAHSVDAELNEARRCHIVNILRLSGVPEAEQRVVIGFPEAEGLYGEEAELAYLRMLQGQQALGGFGGAFSPFGASFNAFSPFGGFGGFGPFGGLGTTGTFGSFGLFGGPYGY